MDVFIRILAGFGLAAPAGLNAWLPLLIVGLAARITDLIHLNPPYDLLSNGWVLLILAILLGVEIFADKIPVVDSVNDVIHTVIRPVSGAILFAANADAFSSMNPAVALILGLVAAGGVHAIKATTRPFITATTGGIANPLVSLVEDVLAAVTTILALFVPVVAVIVLILALFFSLRFITRLRNRRAAQPATGKR